ncbi:hypothetical protein PWI24_11510, partial [Salmonella enterica subsp. enterica]
LKIINAVRKNSCNLLRVVTLPRSLNPPSSGFCRFWAWDSLGLAYPAVIDWLGFFYVSASDLRYVVFPQFAPAVSAR